MEISPKAIKNRQRKIEERNQRSKKIKKIKNIKKQNSKNLIYQILKVINNSFPDLFDRIREIEDYRKKFEYELAELITASLCIFLKRAPAMHLIMTGKRKILKRIIKRFSKCNCLTWIQ
jgi:hypothetical protein